MGFRYWAYRAWYEIKKRMGILNIQHSSDLPHHIYTTEQLNSGGRFFIPAELKLQSSRNEKLETEAENILAGRIRFFSGAVYELGIKYDWLTDPSTGKKYSANEHWSSFNDFGKDADIKFVWEKSRFSYLLTIIRHDHHSKRDCGEFALNEIISWINHSKPNCGPQYLSSQEIAIRLLNWIFCLAYYKNHPGLDNKKFTLIMNSIEIQLDHIEKNLNFSKYLVRNNHILAEAATLFIAGTILNFLPGSEKRKVKGLRIFEDEINFQINSDGSYLQYSMNYNRVVVQLLTWVIKIANLNNIVLNPSVIQKAKATNRFLYSFMDKTNGQLPNYGANDGSLFFPLNDNDYRDFRPQIQALNSILDDELEFDSEFEDAWWYGNSSTPVIPSPQKSKLVEYRNDGYYLIKEPDSFTMIRCGNHKHRPSQADNLHIDIWYQSNNILRDAGTFQYNCEPELVRFYFGTASHNTVMIGDLDQMKKGRRFIWYYWTSSKFAQLQETDDSYLFTGEIKAFHETGKWITHRRTVRKLKNKLQWEIFDEIAPNQTPPVTQIWNPSELFFDLFEIEATDGDGQKIPAEIAEGYYSETYGIKTPAKRILFKTNGHSIRSFIRLK